MFSYDARFLNVMLLIFLFVLTVYLYYPISFTLLQFLSTLQMYEASVTVSLINYLSANLKITCYDVEKNALISL